MASPGRIGAGALVALALCLGALFLGASPAAALDSDLKGSAFFQLEASNGYRILVLAASERADGRTDAGVYVARRGGGVVYAVPATVTPTSFEADLGALGRVSLEIVPTGAKKTLRPRCGGEPVTVEPNLYRGAFEFHGEEGFAEATATRIPEFSRFFVDFGCGGAFRREAGGPGLPGASLRVHAGNGHHRTSLQVNQNRPGARTFFEAQVSEKRGRIEIARFVSGRAPANAFAFDPLLRTATLDPPSPFSGRATFQRDASRPNRWRGDLAVDFPGRSAVPLTPPGARVTLAHARLTHS